MRGTLQGEFTWLVALSMVLNSSSLYLLYVTGKQAALQSTCCNLPLIAFPAVTSNCMHGYLRMKKAFVPMSGRE